MRTTSERLYIIVLTLFTAIALIAWASGREISKTLEAASGYLATLSIALIVFPLIAVPLMFQVLELALKLGEKPTKSLYRDFNRANFVVSLGAIAEILLLLFIKILGSGPLRIILSAVAFGNLAAFMALFLIVTLLIHKIVNELEPVFTREEYTQEETYEEDA